MKNSRLPSPPAMGEGIVPKTSPPEGPQESGNVGTNLLVNIGIANDASSWLAPRPASNCGLTSATARRRTPRAERGAQDLGER